MNAFEKLEVHQNEEFKEHLKNIETLEADIFNKEKILAFGAKYDIMPEDVKEEVLKALEEIKNDEGYKKIAMALLYCLKNGVDHNAFKPDFEEGIKAQFVIFFPIWYMVEEFAEDMVKRGVPQEIIIKSLAPVCGCLKKNKELTGSMGTSAYFFWIHKHALGELFNIGAFQYEPVNRNGKNLINIHIPAGTKLNVQDNLKSFKEAMDFYDKYYPEFKMEGLMCESWLLSNEVEEVMGGPTNITRFGNMFKKYSIGDERGDAVFRFVYNFAAPYPPIEDLPENTTLQRKLKAYMLSGKRVYNMGGTISREELLTKLKEFEA